MQRLLAGSTIAFLALSACDSGDTHNRMIQMERAQEEAKRTMDRAKEEAAKKLNKQPDVNKTMQAARARALTIARMVLLYDAAKAAKGSADIWPATFSGLNWPHAEDAKDAYGNTIILDGLGEVRSGGPDKILGNADDWVINADGTANFEIKDARMAAEGIMKSRTPAGE